jgi:signal transduction histidine kinase
MDKVITTYLVIFFVSFVIFLGGIVFLLFLFRNKQKLNQRETQLLQQKHQEELLTAELEIQLQTMRTIGQEIHDNVGQKLTLASIYTQQISYENKAPKINDKIETVSSIINESLQELRRLSKTLTDNKIAQNNLVQLIEEECNAIRATKICHVNFNKPTQPINLTYEGKSIATRIVQEFLHNAVKHAKCQTITIDFSFDKSFFVMRLKDDGIGFDLSKLEKKGIGLQNIAQRVAIVKGNYEIDSTPGKGTELIIEIPTKNET